MKSGLFTLQSCSTIVNFLLGIIRETNCVSKTGACCEQFRSGGMICSEPKLLGKLLSTQGFPLSSCEFEVNPCLDFGNLPMDTTDGESGSGTFKPRLEADKLGGIGDRPEQALLC